MRTSPGPGKEGAVGVFASDVGVGPVGDLSAKAQARGLYLLQESAQVLKHKKAAVLLFDLNMTRNGTQQIRNERGDVCLSFQT